MAEPVIGRVAAARGFVAQIWKLAAPYWWSEERWLARGLLAVIIAHGRLPGLAVEAAQRLERAVSSTRCRTRTARRSGAADLLDEPVAFFFSFIGLVFVYIVVAVYRLWLRQYLTIRWRRWLTEVYFQRLAGRPHLLPHGAGRPRHRQPRAADRAGHRHLHHPDAGHRAWACLSEIMTLVTFTYVLWGLSGSFILPFSAASRCPATWCGWRSLYAIAGSCATYWIGRPLGAGQLRPRALQRRFPLPDDPHPRERREHRPLRRRAGRGAAAATAPSAASTTPFGSS